MGNPAGIWEAQQAPAEPSPGGGAAARAAYWRRGEPMVWVTGAALAASVLMIAALVGFVAWRGLGMFRVHDLVLLELDGGEGALGEVRAREKIPGDPAGGWRLQLKVGNRDLYGLDFRWIEEERVTRRSLPEDAVAVQRVEYGDLFGFVAEVRRGDEILAAGRDGSFEALRPLLAAAEEKRRQIRAVQRHIGRVNNQMEETRLALRAAELDAAASGSPLAERERARFGARHAALEAEYESLRARLDAAVEEASRVRFVVETADGQTKDLPVLSALRVRRPNRMGGAARLWAYAAAVWEFVSGQPRESNTEGGILPAIFGTVLMVLVMSVAVVPLGVLAALYLREYAREGVMVRTVRIAVNNLAGVPSIVFGVFGLAFFIYTLGGGIDRLFYAASLPTPTFGTGGILWASLTLALLTVPVVIVSTEEALAAVPREYREGGLALGATRWQTVSRIILPSASPGILTGMILARARGAGEVAPLMLTGVVKLAPELPLDVDFPFLHLERKFMHLGFHIYDVGFQSPNVEASKPMVYATAFLMIALILLLNLTAILIRNRLRRRLRGAV